MNLIMHRSRVRIWIHSRYIGGNLKEDPEEFCWTRWRLKFQAPYQVSICGNWLIFPCTYFCMLCEVLHRTWRNKGHLESGRWSIEWWERTLVVESTYVIHGCSFKLWLVLYLVSCGDNWWWECCIIPCEIMSANVIRKLKNAENSEHWIKYPHYHCEKAAGFGVQFSKTFSELLALMHWWVKWECRCKAPMVSWWHSLK